MFYCCYYLLFFDLTEDCFLLLTLCINIVHGSLNLDVVSLVISLIVFLLSFTAHMSVYWVTHDSGISPFWFALYKLHNFLVNMSFVNTIIGVCNKMVLT